MLLGNTHLIEFVRKNTSLLMIINVVCIQGPCCTTECRLKVGDMCRNDNGCRDPSYCNGLNPQCPPSINKPNKTVCNEEYVCYMGVCIFDRSCSEAIAQDM